MTDADEAFGKHVQKEAAQKLIDNQSHEPFLVAVRVILPTEAHPVRFEGQQTMIGNGHAVGVATEIAQNLQGTTESGLGIDDPVVAMQAADEFRELLGVGKSGRGPGTVRFLTAMKSFQPGEELAAENTAEDLHG